MDTQAFVSLAHVRILLVPVASISPLSFDEYASLIRSYQSIRLGDIPTGHKDERARFMPSPLSTGRLQLSFPTHPPPRSHLALSLIRPSHFPLAVIGIAECSKGDTLSGISSQFNSSLVDIFPPDGIYPLAKSCFIFGDSDDNTLVQGTKIPGLVLIPNVMGNKHLYIGTLLADLCSQMLSEFGVVVQALESPLGNEYLNSAVLPILPTLSDIPSAIDGTKRDSLPQLSPPNVQQNGSATSLPISTVPSVKRASSVGPVFRQMAVRNEKPPRKRLSSIGVTSSHARLYKVLGDLFLLAARPQDATIWYTEALILFKSSQDFAWHAATLEGLASASITEAYSAGDGLQSFTGAKPPWTDISDRLSQATALYSRSPTNEGEPNYPLLAYLYVCSVLRHSSLLFAIWSAGGWGPPAFTTMLQPNPKFYIPGLFPNEPNRWESFERLSSISGVSRSSIASILGQVHGPWLLHLGARERISILEATSSLYACLGYRRKEAYVLREVLGCIMDLMVCGREEDGLSRIPSNPGMTGLRIHGLNSSGLGLGWNDVGVRISESIEGNESLLSLQKYVCKILGVDLEAVKRTKDICTTTVTEDHDNDVLTDIVQSYGWPELQVGVVREAVAVAEALPDFFAVAQFALSALKTLQAILSPGDQYHLYATASRALATAKRRGDNHSIEYWAGRPILGITLAPTTLALLPVEKPISVLQARPQDAGPILTGGIDPFLYNPRKISASQGKPLVVQKEHLEFIVTLQNPYIFDLDLQALSLSTSGVPFESSPIHVLIPANSSQEVVLSGRALETGILTIRGCFVEAPGGTRREFVLPLLTDDEEERLYKKRSCLIGESGRTKYSGLDWFLRQRSSGSTGLLIGPQKDFRYLECKVIPQQPLLRIRRTSITHGAVMLYNGEKSIIHVTLENVSPFPVDFLRLAFEDSTIASTQQALSDGQLSVFDTYEIEYSLIHRPLFSWNQEDAKDIQPGEKLTIPVICRGKVGCTTGTIYFSYSHIHRGISDEGSAEVFHTRQISYPVMVTVFDMLECHGMDILPFPLKSSRNGNASHGTRLQIDEYHNDDEGSWCLFSIKVRNTYGLPFQVSLERVQEGVPHTAVTETIPQGSMARLVIPIRKYLLSEEERSQPIPALSDRQFVVQESKLTQPETDLQKELFWYREHLFHCIRGQWREIGGIRSGELSLRQQRLSLPMLETLRMENARISMSLISRDNSRPEGESVAALDGRFYPPANEFVYLRTKITNVSRFSLVFTMDLEMEPSEYVIHEDVVSDLVVGRLHSGDSREVETAICFLANGRFEISADVRVLESRGARTGTGHLIAVVEEVTAR